MTAAEYLHTVHETRRKRLLELIATFETMGDASREIGLSLSYVSRLCGGRHPFTESVARQIEGNFGLEFGALDLVRER